MVSKSEKQKRKELKKASRGPDVPSDPFFRRLHDAKAFNMFLPSDAAETPDDELKWRVVVVVHNRIGKQYDREEGNRLPASVPVKAVFATWMVESEEKCNGGFAQFFFNQRPYLAKLAVDGYEVLASRTASCSNSHRSPPSGTRRLR